MSITSPNSPTLPVEILTQIFTLVTTLDSGASLRSLRRVSQLFNDICIPLKFLSLSLTTASSIEKLHQELQRLENSPPHLRRIQHLYISLDASDMQSESELDTISQIFFTLQTAADTLQTLTFIYHNSPLSASVIGRLFREPLPVLTELTVHGFYPFPSPVPSSESVSFLSVHSLEMNQSCMPQLRRLHLSGNRNPHGLLQLSSLDVCFPSLTHLRISGLLMAASFAEEMKGALEMRSDDIPEGTCGMLPCNRAILPSKLESVVLQPGYAPMLDRSGVLAGSALKKDTRMMVQLKNIEEAAKRRRGVHVIVKDRMQDPARIPVGAVLYRDWLGRMNGDEGCW
ncbi:hypothetical protein FB446DRAFT_271442 [Lentinula raphanica]|nr:hypothetical protein FB446DRAFT_271442 [Lentinula raphanica]